MSGSNLGRPCGNGIVPGLSELIVTEIPWLKLRRGMPTCVAIELRQFGKVGFVNGEYA